MILLPLVALAGCCTREGFNVSTWPAIEIDADYDPRPHLDTSQPPSENERLLMTYIRRLEAAIDSYNRAAEEHNARVAEELP